MMGSLIEIEDLTKWYIPKGKNEDKIIKAVDGIDLSINKGEVLGIIGESGCGKSTLARLLVALEKPTFGSIKFEGIPINQILKENRLYFKKNCQMIFQDPFDTFDPRNNIQKILTTPLKTHNIGSSHKKRTDIIIKVMEEAGIKPAKDFIHRYPHELSGGQLQRISIIRSMLLNPKLIIADEPVSMLDVSVRADIINILLNLTKKHGVSMIFISHDIATTCYISDKIAIMYLGKVVEIGSTDDIIKKAKHPYTKVLISNCASIDPFEKRDKIKVKGEPPTPVGTGPGCYFYERCYKSCNGCKESYPEMMDLGNGHYASCFNI